MEIDRKVVGHWRNTDSMSDGGMAVVTDTHYQLDEDGSFEHWVKSRSAGFDQSDSLRHYGHWEAKDGNLALKFNTGESFTTPYTLQGDMLFLPEEPRLRVWHRLDKTPQWI